MKPALWLFALLLAAAPHAPAQWHAAGYLGGPLTTDSDLQVSQPALENAFVVRNVSWQGQSFEGPLYYGVRGGYFFASESTLALGVDVEFIHSKVFAEIDRTVVMQGTLAGAPFEQQAPMRSVVQRFSLSHGVNLLLFNGAMRWSPHSEDGPGRFLLTGRLGLGTSVPHAESTVLGIAQEQYDAPNGLAFQAAGGAEVRLWRSLYLLGEYKFTRVRPEVEISNGTAETLLESHHLVSGLSVHF